MINSYKIILIAVLVFFAISHSEAQALSKKKASLKKILEVITKDSSLIHSSFGLLLVDAQSGETIIEDNRLKAIYAASNTKLFSTALALSVLGKDHVQHSRLFYDGTIASDSTLLGNIIIDGNYNPCLGSGAEAEKSERDDFLKRWVEVIRKKGIKKITGTVLAFEPNLWRKRLGSWMVEDIFYAYGCAASRTGCFDNSFTIRALLPIQGQDSNRIVSVYPKQPKAVFFNRIQKDSLKKTEIYVSENSELGSSPFYTLSGSIKRDRDTASLELAQADPARTLADLLADALKRQSIGLREETRVVDELPLSCCCLDSIGSARVGELVRYTNLHSNNLFAESLLRMAAQKMGYKGNDLGKFLLDYWNMKGIPTGGMTLADGSGLSRFDAISPQQLVALLKTMQESENRDIFKQSLPVSGVSGTLKSFCKGTEAESRIFAKTGSATGVQCYSGYIETTSGKNLIFSLLINQFSGPRAAMRKKLEILFNQIIKI